MVRFCWSVLCLCAPVFFLAEKDAAGGGLRFCGGVLCLCAPAAGRFAPADRLEGSPFLLRLFVFVCACLFPCGKRVGWRCHPFLFRHESGSPFVRFRLLFWLSCFAGLLGDCLFLWGDPDGGRTGLGFVLSFYTKRSASFGRHSFLL